jgi:Raf kinase inhibitor-like YbhB/YbcL family protein
MKLTIVGVGAALTVLAGPAAATMTLTSADIRPNGPISAAQTYPRCGGQNISPQLSWSGAPAKAQSLVLTMIDLDVKPALWSHWIVVDLPTSSTGLARGLKSLPGAAAAMTSNFGDAAYDGPCPPAGTGVHHYQFTIWAMPANQTAIAPDAKANTIEAWLSRTALDKGSLVGWVRR